MKMILHINWPGEKGVKVTTMIQLDQFKIAGHKLHKASGFQVRKIRNSKVKIAYEYYLCPACGMWGTFAEFNSVKEAIKTCDERIVDKVLK